MNRHLKTSSIVAFLSAVASAQVGLPFGKDMDRYVMPPADTLYLQEEGIDTLPNPTDPGFASTIKDWQDDLRVSSVSVDTANRLLRYSYVSVGVVKRSNGVVAEVETTYPKLVGTLDFTRWSFDAQGRRTRLVSGTRSKEIESKLDTLELSWSNEGCADEIFETNSKRTWTVDADGRCAYGKLFYRTGGVWNDENIAVAVLWKDNRLAVTAELEIDGSNVDTLAKDVYSHDDAGNWTGTLHYVRTEAGAWRLAARTTNNWASGRFADGMDTEYDLAGRTVWTFKVSATPPAVGVRSRIKGGQNFVTARMVEGALEFANATSAAVRVRVATPDGKALADLSVAARGRATWTGSAKAGVILWSAQGNDHRVSGRVVTGR